DLLSRRFTRAQRNAKLLLEINLVARPSRLRVRVASRHAKEHPAETPGELAGWQACATWHFTSPKPPTLRSRRASAVRGLLHSTPGDQSGSDNAAAAIHPVVVSFPPARILSSRAATSRTTVHWRGA